MTEAAAAGSEPMRYVEAWSAALAQVLGQISGSAVPSAVLAESPAELAPASDTDLWVLCTCAGGLRGEMCLRISPSWTVRLAQTLMSEPPAPQAEVSPEHREAALELLRQVAGLVTSALKARWGEVQLHLDAATGPPSWSASSTFWLRAGEGESTAALVELLLSAALVAALRTEKTEAIAAAEPAPTSAAAPASASGSPVKLDLLMNVDLAVTLRFGSRRMVLREVLDLNPGAVVELDRQVQDPVDVLLDGRLVARGEIVLIDGNYGLRVTEVGPVGS